MKYIGLRLNQPFESRANQKQQDYTTTIRCYRSLSKKEWHLCGLLIKH